MPLLNFFSQRNITFNISRSALHDLNFVKVLGSQIAYGLCIVWVAGTGVDKRVVMLFQNAIYEDES